MDPDSRPGPAAAGIPEVIVADRAWRRMVPRLDALVRRAAGAAGGVGTVLLASDSEVRRLNGRYRGRNKPTNVLTFDSGDLALAAGVVRREARAAGGRWRIIWRIWWCTARCICAGWTMAARGRPGAWRWRRPSCCTACACRTRGGRPDEQRAMSGVNGRTFLDRVRQRLLGRQEHGVRQSIADLVNESAQEAPEDGVIPELDRQERVLIANVLRLRETVADDVMVPRADIVAIPIDVSLEQALEHIRREGHSRLPVYREELDDVAGMVHIKDVFAYAGQPDAFRLESLLRRPLLVSPQVPVLDLLLQMRQARMHLALVVDEYGGIDGLLTIEDLVEEIVGDIADEHDEVQGPMIVERPDGALDLDARLSIEAFEARLGPVVTDDEREADIDTVGGLVFNLAGRVPSRGEVVSHGSGLEFRVLESDARRIRRLRVRRAVEAPLPPT